MTSSRPLFSTDDVIMTDRAKAAAKVSSSAAPKPPIAKSYALTRISNDITKPIGKGTKVNQRKRMQKEKKIDEEREEKLSKAFFFLLDYCSLCWRWRSMEYRRSSRYQKRQFKELSKKNIKLLNKEGDQREKSNINNKQIFFF